MPLTSELINERIKAARDYEKYNLGIKNGPDFADIARLLMNSEEFKGLAMSCSLMAMLTMLTRKEDDPSEDKDKFMEEMTSGSKEPLALMFYIGYRLGKAEGETSQLDRMLSSSDAR